MREPTLAAKLGAEFLGTFWLVFGGCGSAVLAAKFISTDADKVQLGIGFVGVSRWRSGSSCSLARTPSGTSPVVISTRR